MHCGSSLRIALITILVGGCAHRGGRPSAESGRPVTQPPEVANERAELQALFDDGQCEAYLEAIETKTWLPPTPRAAPFRDLQKAECFRKLGREADARALFQLVADDEAGSLPGDWASARLAGETYTPPKAEWRAEPFYPPWAAQSGVMGNVILAFDVEADGSVSSVRVLESAPPDVFDQTAIAALKRWRYKPAMRDNHPVRAGDMRVTLQFRLPDP